MKGLYSNNQGETNLWILHIYCSFVTTARVKFVHRSLLFPANNAPEQHLSLISLPIHQPTDATSGIKLMCSLGRRTIGRAIYLAAPFRSPDSSTSSPLHCVTVAQPPISILPQTCRTLAFSTLSTRFFEQLYLHIVLQSLNRPRHISHASETPRSQSGRGPPSCDQRVDRSKKKET
jgi:hypothetical protein